MITLVGGCGTVSSRNENVQNKGLRSASYLTLNSWSPKVSLAFYYYYYGKMPHLSMKTHLYLSSLPDDLTGVGPSTEGRMVGSSPIHTVTAPRPTTLAPMAQIYAQARMKGRRSRHLKTATDIVAILASRNAPACKSHGRLLYPNQRTKFPWGMNDGINIGT